MEEQPALVSEGTTLTATTDPEIRAIVEKHGGDTKPKVINEQDDTSNGDSQNKSKIHRGGVKAQFYPELTPKMGSITHVDVVAADKRFGQREEEEEFSHHPIRVSVTKVPDVLKNGEESSETVGVFSTAVDESVIQAAVDRQQRAVGGVHLQEEIDNPVFITGREVVMKRAKEQ